MDYFIDIMTSPMNLERVVGLIDMDCFYAQVEQREAPELWGKPVIVVQHASGNAAGGALAVSYEARKFKIKRGMTAAQAKALCPDLSVRFVPQGEHIDKADISKYRNASEEVFDVLNNFDGSIVVEKASVDEAYLDLTRLVDSIVSTESDLQTKYCDKFDDMFATSHLADGEDCGEDYDRTERLKNWLRKECDDLNELRIAVGARVCEQIRSAITEKTQFFCSAGVANNKTMAKLVCARHKPRQQSLLPHRLTPVILRNTPIADVRGLGGKLGVTICERLRVTTMGELSQVDEESLARAFPGQSKWIWKIARGQDDEPVKARQLSSSIAVSKNFPGRNSLRTVKDVKEWTEGLVKELAKRLAQDQIKNRRTATSLLVGVVGEDGSRGQKTVVLPSTQAHHMTGIVWNAVRQHNKGKGNQWKPFAENIHISAHKFVEGVGGDTASIMDWVGKRTKQLDGMETIGREDEGKENKEEEEAGPSAEQTTAAVAVPESVTDMKTGGSFVKAIDSSHNLAVDADGWQVWKNDDLNAVDMVNDVERASPQEWISPPPAATPTSTPTPPLMTAAAVTRPSPASTPDNMLTFVTEEGVQKVDKKVFNELPEYIKQELTHYQNLQDAKNLKAMYEAKQAAKKASQPTTLKQSTSKAPSSAARKRPAKKEGGGTTAKKPPTNTLDKFFAK